MECRVRSFHRKNEFTSGNKKSHGDCLSARDGPERLACTPADEAGVEKDQEVSFGCWFALILVNEVADLVRRNAFWL